MTPVAPRHFCVAGVVLGDLHLDFTWQAWHNLTSTLVLRGRRSLMALGGALGPGLGGRDARGAAPLLRGVLRGRRLAHGTGWRSWARLGGRDARGAAPLLRGRRGTW